MVRSRQTPPKDARQRDALRFMASIQGVLEHEMHPPKEVVDALLDFSPPEMRSLMWLGRSGVTVMTDFAKGINVPLSTATRIVNRLVKKNLVVRRRSEFDRRIVEVDLSPIGYEHKACFHARRLRISQKILAPLSEPERETLLSLMEKALELSAKAAEGLKNKT
ncbi:MAG: MarR family transcriptional regulator [Granulicella sp.]